MTSATLTAPRHAALDQLLSWGLPAFLGLCYFIAAFPGLLHGDSWAQWRTAAQFLEDPAGTEITSWFSPILTIVRVWALESGLGYIGYHTLYCLLTISTWAAFVATLLLRPGHRALAHLFLLLPFVGGSLVLQAADVFVACGLALVLIALCQQSRAGGAAPSWRSLLAYAAGCLLILGARFNAWLILPLLSGLPLMLPRGALAGFRAAAALAPLGALAVVWLLPASWPVREDMKPEVHATFEIIGIWKLASTKEPEAEPPAVFSLLEHPPDYYLERWNHADVDTLIWYTESLRDRSLYRGGNRNLIRRDYVDTIRRFPTSFVEMKLLILRSGLGYEKPVDDYLGWRYPDDWLFEEWMPERGREIGSRISHAVYGAWEATRWAWEPLARPWAWWLAFALVLAWRLAWRKADWFDAASVWLLASYHATILFFAPAFYPRYAIPVWIVLGPLVIRGLLGPGRTAIDRKIPQTSRRVA